MRYEKLISVVLTVSLFGYISIGKSAGKPGNSQMRVTYRLLVEKKVGSQATEIACRLRVENRTDTVQFVSRPEEKDISLSVKGLDTRRYSLSLEKRGFESLATREIPLRPTCAIEMKLARIVPSGAKEGESVIPPGNYLVSASWKQAGLPDVRPGQFEVIAGYQPPASDVQPRQDEYPLGITLEPSAKRFYRDEPIVFSVRIQNNGGLPVTLMNHFDRYTDFFRFEKKDAASGKKLEGYRGPVALISPNAREGWITLLPGESLSVAIDASDEFKTPGEYYVTVTYYRSRILIYPKDGKPKDPIYPSLGLIFPPDGKPYYTKQHNWTSNEIDVVISETTKEKQVEEKTK